MLNTEGSFAQSGQYDKILKENLEITLPTIIKDVLNLEVIQSEELPDNIQHTKERKPDVLRKVTNKDGQIYVLHIEFQTNDDREMVYRMADYYIMLLRKYRIPIRQYVVFLKNMAPAMAVSLDTEHLIFHYKLIKISDTNYEIFTHSQDPEVKMLGILANFGNQEISLVIKSIVKGIHDSGNNKLEIGKYFKQLRILVQLRKPLINQIEKAMESVSTFFREEDDFLYRRGERKAKELVIRNLLLKLKLSDESIADMVQTEVAEVKRIRQEVEAD